MESNLSNSKFQIIMHSILRRKHTLFKCVTEKKKPGTKLEELSPD